MNKKWVTGIAFLLTGLILVDACRKPEELVEEDHNEWLTGGSQTVFDRGASAFGHAFPFLSADKARVHEVGDLAFEATFVTAPARLNPGLGPLYNSVSCASCHIGDGRGKPPGPGEALLSMLIRVSVPGTDAHGGPNPAPGFGGQLQQRAIVGKQPEAQVQISYQEQTYYFADQTPYQLRYPSYALVNSYIPLPAGIMLSPRVAPPVFGLGLLEAIPEQTILAMADENDRDGDGISGKANMVWDVQANRRTLGRFGWKAGQPTLLQQSAAAYNEDMGVTNFMFPQESSYGQAQYELLSKEMDISDSVLHAVGFYIRTLAVPGRRNANTPEVLRGKSIFTQAKCASCHVPSVRTGVNVSFPEISNQKIFPYTDLLLHDMGDELADHRPEFDANGNEWRTPPLWGIGLTRIVNGHNNFLHDGRARTLLEAIMWHGGEAAYSRDYVKTLTKPDRDALIKFLESL